RGAASPTSHGPGSGPWPPARSSAAADHPSEPARSRPALSATGGSPARPPPPPPGGPPAGPAYQRAAARCALPREGPEPVPLARLVLRGHEPEVPADALGVAEAVRVVDERDHRLGRAGADPRDGPQQGDGRRLSGRAGAPLPLSPAGANQ